MERMLVSGWSESGLANALAGDRHYDGLQAPDGTDISTRTKHREFMKRTGLTVTDDFKETWKKDAGERELRRLGQHEDKRLHQTLERELYRRS